MALKRHLYLTLPTIMKKISLQILFTVILVFGMEGRAQDTVVYKGILRGDFLIETIKLYPDSTFEWTNEYDLTWSQYGKYKLVDNKLILDFYIFSDYPETMSLKDSISYIAEKSESRRYEIENNRIYPLTDQGKRITKMEDPYFRRKWGWLLGNRFEYKISRTD